MTAIETLIGQYAFPIAVTAYLLYERSKLTKEFTTALSNNTKVIAELKTVIEARLK